MYVCKYCNNKKSNSYPECCFLKMNNKLLNKMTFKTILEINESSDYYTKCINFHLSDGSIYKFQYTNDTIFIDESKSTVLPKVNYIWIWMTLVFILSCTCLLKILFW